MLTQDDIFNAAQSLSPLEQWELVSRLWAALPPETWLAVDDETLAEWDRRVAEIDGGAVEAIPGDQVHAFLRSKIEHHG